MNLSGVELVEKAALIVRRPSCYQLPFDDGQTAIIAEMTATVYDRLVAMAAADAHDA